MSALNDAAMKIIENVLKSTLGDKLPIIMNTIEKLSVTVGKFENDLTVIKAQQNVMLTFLKSIDDKLTIQAAGGMSISERIESGGNIIRETSQGVDLPLTQMIASAENARTFDAFGDSSNDIFGTSITGNE